MKNDRKSIDKSTNEPEFMPISKAAKILGISAETLRVWIIDGRIEHLRINASNPKSRRAKITYLVPRHAIDRFIEDHTVKVGQTAKLPESRKKKSETARKPMLRI